MITFTIKALGISRSVNLSEALSALKSHYPAVSIEPQAKLEVLFDEVVLSKFDEKRMLVIGNLMSQSVGLDSYEKKIESLIAMLV